MRGGLDIEAAKSCLKEGLSRDRTSSVESLLAKKFKNGQLQSCTKLHPKNGYAAAVICMENVWTDPPKFLVTRLLRKLRSTDIKATRFVCKSWKQSLDCAITELTPRNLSLKHVNMLSSLFPLLRTLDCSHMATPSKQKLRTIVKLPNLTGLCIEGNDDTGNGVLEVVVKARQLTQLTLDSAQAINDAGLALLENLKELKILHLVSCQGFSGFGLSVLTALPKLRELHLAACGALNGRELLSLADIPQLTKLNLGNLSLDVDLTSGMPLLAEGLGSPATSSDLAEEELDDFERGPRHRQLPARWHMDLEPRLGHVDFLDDSYTDESDVSDRSWTSYDPEEEEHDLSTFSPDVSETEEDFVKNRDKFLRWLIALPDLTMGLDPLTLMGRDGIVSTGWFTPYLSRLGGLTHIVVGPESLLRGVQSSCPSMFPAFRLLASLKVVEIRLPVAVEGPLWEPLAELKTLLGLIITIRHLKAEDCSLGKLDELKSLELHVEGNIERGGLSPVASLPNLLYFQLVARNCLSEEFEGWQHGISAKLCSLTLQGCRGLSKFGRTLGNLTQLTHLALSCVNEPPGAILSRLRGLPKLARLHLHTSGMINDGNISFLRQLPDLVHLSLACAKVHSGLSCLSQLTKLTSLELDATAISDSTMPALESLCQMQTLSISYTGVSHEGLSHLSRMTALQELTITGCRLMDEKPMVQSLRGLITCHSLNKICVLGIHIKKGYGKDMPCQWVVSNGNRGHST